MKSISFHFNMHRAYIIPILVLFLFTIGKANQLQNRKLIQDTIPPTAICDPGVDTINMFASGYITIYARDFAGNSYDNVSSFKKLKFYFNGLKNADTLQIRCIDLTNGTPDGYAVQFEIWVEDEAGNTDHCAKEFFFVDYSDFCQIDWIQIHIKGKIETISGDLIIAHQSLMDHLKLINENTSSTIHFDNLRSNFYTLCLDKNENHLNGVSTADIVRIQRHILGIELLNSPYKLLAADVNYSNTISAADITEIRRLILGFKSEFSKVPSWIFIPKRAEFKNDSDLNLHKYIPSCFDLEIKQYKSIDDLDYFAIKMGDINNTARNLIQTETFSRQKEISLFYQTTDLADEFSVTSFELSNNINLSSLQFSLIFDPLEVTPVKIQNAAIKFEVEQYSFLDAPLGKIHVAWDKSPLENTNINTGTLFSILWKKKTTVKTAPIIYFDSERITPLVSDENLNEFYLRLQNKITNSSDHISAFQDFQKQSIEIEINNSNESLINYTIHDISGHFISQKTIRMAPGNPQISIPLQILPVNGIYLFKLQSGQYTQTFKLVKL